MCAWRRSSALLASRSPRARPSWIRASLSTPLRASLTDIWAELPAGAVPLVSTSSPSATSGGGEVGSSPSDCSGDCES